ncbi:DNA-binding NarL/FixJ family response regulator [Methylohalomonas lacus]|uniref:DNA-binding NarL/FixJ family response regulator n=1 Tax=Methylohalomonas lacus TaxID=398773 RepID=A0AAE3L129_9GAMM|nr:response regulator transcription factor [Methylohalomonas lacus]MCS3902561.1 DNA-binding NarL/FixJ family response regulator [Methylohalomonas lacus]
MTSKPNPIRVMLVDDHAVVRAGYRMLLKNSVDIEVIAEADNGESACKQYNQLQPDIVVMDLSLPGIGGLEAIRRIIARDPDARILVFSMHEDTIFVEQALQAGAQGYMTKSGAPEALIDAVRALASGKTHLDKNIAERLAFQKMRGKDTPFSGLSTREFEIFCLLAEGHSTSDIAKRLSLSYKTVANYSTQIKNKLEVGSIAEIARLAIRHQIVNV